MKKIILASTSPRRQEILAKLGIPFTVVSSEYEEDMTLAMSPTDLVQHLASGKAGAVAAKHPKCLIIAADSIVAYKNKVLGKPKSKQHALDLLTELSGSVNEIITGVAIWDLAEGKKVSFAGTTKVFMKNMSEEDIRAYVESGEPLDKAGAYAIQGLGSIFIEKIEGDFYNAMGLPLGRIAEELQKLGVNIL